MTTISKCSTFIVSKGEHEDYTVLALFITVQDIDPQVLLDEYIGEHPESVTHQKDNYKKFVEWLGLRPELVKMPFHDWCVGAYGRLYENAEVDLHGG